MRVRRRPGFLSGQNGSLFLVEMRPESGESSCAIVMLAPFAEEMNRCRRMLALQAEQLAASGMRAVLFDYSGTGDSEGHFGDATVASWRADAHLLAEHLRATGSQSILWLGARFGALLAAELVRSVQQSAGAVLWQPVHAGRQIVSQFRRLQTAARMAGGAADSRATEGTFGAGDATEIAGYMLNRTLLEELEALELPRGEQLAASRIAWYDVVPEANQPLGPASRRTIEAWSRAGAQVDAEAVSGEQFWSTVEISLAPALLERTTATAMKWAARG